MNAFSTHHTKHWQHPLAAPMTSMCPQHVALPMHMSKVYSLCGRAFHPKRSAVDDGDEHGGGGKVVLQGKVIEVFTVIFTVVVLSAFSKSDS